VKATIVGLNMMIDGQNPTGKKLPYAHVTFEGKGEEATFALLSGKARVAKKAKAKKSAKAA
jgi:hypothetical protein